MTQATDIEARIIDSIGGLTHDPLRFVRFAYPWGEPGLLEKREGPEPWQREVLAYIGSELRAGRKLVRVCVTAGHGVGKSALMAWLRDWSMATMPGCRGMVTANTFDQLRTKTVPEMSKWSNLSIAAHWFKATATSLFGAVAPDTWRFDALPWSAERPEAFAGLHNAGRRIVILFDEASAIADVIYETVEGALTDEDTEIIWVIFGNPTRATGRFAEARWGRHRHRWKGWSVDSREVSHTNKAEIESWIETYGEDSDFVRVRVKGERPRAGSTQFIGVDLIERATKREVVAVPSDPLVYGVDVARDGDDQTVIWRRRGTDARTWAPTKLRSRDLMQIATVVADMAGAERPDAIFVDETGIGAGVGDRLRQLNVPHVIGVQFGGRPDRGAAGHGAPVERYANKRAEMWGVMRHWLERGGIPDDQELAADLGGPEYGHNERDEIQLERKKDMKKRGLASPDCADALALTFAYPVMARERGSDLPRARAADYDPLAAA